VLDHLLWPETTVELIFRYDRAVLDISSYQTRLPQLKA
jgi:hypothetical protein